MAPMPRSVVPVPHPSSSTCEQVVNQWEYMVVLEDDVPIPENFATTVRKIAAEKSGPNADTRCSRSYLEYTDRTQPQPPRPHWHTSAGFTDADLNQTVEIRNGVVRVNGTTRAVRWGDAVHADCTGKIGSVEPNRGTQERPMRGKVKLYNGTSSLGVTEKWRVMLMWFRDWQVSSLKPMSTPMHVAHTLRGTSK